MSDTFDDTDDRRTTNNTLRHQYRELAQIEKEQIAELKEIGEAFLTKCAVIGQSRELSIARTKIEEATFWAVKHVTA